MRQPEKGSGAPKPPASLALAVLAMVGGAHILRVHDVVETMDAVAMMTAYAEASP